MVLGASLPRDEIFAIGAAADDDAGAAAGFGVCFPVALDLDMPGGA